MNILLIENPAAGKRKKMSALREAFHARLKEGATVTRTQTGQRGDAYHHATAIPADHYDSVVCAGGDGTLHEVVTGLLASPACPPVGYLPSGTTNDFAYSLGLPKEPGTAAEAIMAGETVRVDSGTVNGKPFVYLVSIGTLADVGYETSQKAKNRWGWIAYFFGGVRSLSRIAAHSAVIEHDGGCEKGEYVFCSVSNTKRIGGGIVCFQEGQVVLDDGHYELLLVRKPPNFFATMAVLLSVMMRRPMKKYVALHHTSFARIVFAKPARVCIDGEHGGCHQSLDIVVEPQRIPILVHQ